MAKFLRFAEVRGFLRHRTKGGADERPANRVPDVTDSPNWFTGAAMYFRTALPVACPHVKKLNIYGCEDSPTECEDPVLDIADVWVHLPADRPPISGDCRAQQALALEVAHTGILCAAERFGFDQAPFEAARRQIEQNNYALRFPIGKPRKSPDRKLTAEVWCEFDGHYRTELIVSRGDGTTLCRYPFASADDTSVGQVQWESPDRLRIPLTAITGDAHWLCSLDGTYTFEFPKSSRGSAHQLYQHATMLLDGLWVICDRDAGMALLQQAAAAGDTHARRRLQRLLPASDSSPS